MTAKLRKKALLPAIAMVIASVIALSGVSYAWFTMGNEANLGNIDLSVVAASGIQVSMDAATWRSTLTTAEITGGSYGGYSDHTNQFPTAGILPVSSIGEVVNGKQRMFLGTMKDGKLTAEEQNDVKGNEGQYIAFDLFFQVSADKDIYLNEGSKVTYKDTIDMKTHYASRVSFINLGSASTAAEARTLKTSQSVKIWEPNAKLHTDYVIANGLATADTALDYQGVKAPITDPADLTSPSATYFSKVETIKPAQNNNGEIIDGAEPVVFSLKKGINKVRIYIWLEGQDIDCNNDISSGTIVSALKFMQIADVDSE